MAVVKFLVWYFFDWRGRIGRLAFFAGYVGAMIVSFALERAARLWPVLVFLITSASVLVILALEAKRWHDMGRSALWILWTSLGFTFWIGFTMISLVPWSSLAHTVKGVTGAAERALIIAAFGRWFLVGLILPILIKIGWLALGRGTPGFNDYDFPDRPNLFDEQADERQQYPSTISARVASSQPSQARPTFGRRSL